MKKRILIFAILAAMLLGACSAAAPQTQDTSDLVAGQFGENDLIFIYNGSAYPLNSDAAKLLEALGEDYETTTAPSCVYVGEDKQFDFKNMSIFTYPTDGKDLIDDIYFYGGDFETPKGIRIGSTLEEVKAQYGEGEKVGSSYVYALSGSAKDLKSPKLTFEMSDGIVSGISFYAASNVAEQ